MSDPCAECLIYSACSLPCEPKLIYVESFNRQLEALSPHLYTINGNRRKNIPRAILKQRDAAVKALEEQQGRVKKILRNGVRGLMARGRPLR